MKYTSNYQLLFSIYSIAVLLFFAYPLSVTSKSVDHFGLPCYSLSWVEMKAPTPEVNFDMMTLPLKRAGKLLLVEATVDSMVGNFILDLGAPYLVLNSTYFRNYRVDNRLIAGTVNGFNENVRRTDVSELKIKELSYSNLKADVTDLGHIENRRGVKILGLLGVNLFLDFELEIDISKNVLRIYKLDEGGNRIVKSESKEALVKVPFKLRNNVILLDGYVAGKKIKLSLDSGAEITLLSNTLPVKVTDNITINRQMTLRGVSGNAVEVFGGNLNQLKLGNAELGKFQVMITDLTEMGKAYGSYIDGMLGFGLFTKGKVVLNFKRKDLAIYLFNLNRVEN